MFDKILSSCHLCLSFYFSFILSWAQKYTHTIVKTLLLLGCRTWERKVLFFALFSVAFKHIFLKCRNNMKIHDTVNISLTKRIHSFNWDMLILYGYNYYSNKTVLNGYFHLGPRGICVHIFHQILVFLFCSFWTQPCHVILRCMPSQLNLH